MTAQPTPERTNATVQVVMNEAIRRGMVVTVAVVDDNGVLSHLTRMSGARALSVDLAIRKAVTAARTGRATHEWARMLAADADLARATTASLPDLVLFGGGVPLQADGCVLGAVGVSGGTQEEDTELAELATGLLTRSSAIGIAEEEAEND